MGRTLLCVLGFFLLNILLHCGHAQDSLLTIEPNSSILFTGESVTFICDMREGEHNDWYYKILKNGQEVFPYNSNRNRTLQPLATGDSGEYQCLGRHTVSTEYRRRSNKVPLNVSAHKPKAELRKDTPAGGSVTLTCSVKPSSSGWKYFWYRGEKTSEPLSTQDVVFLSDETISVSQGGLYWCRGGRGNPVYYTEYSDSIVTNRAVVTLQPNWPEIYRGETITLTCEIEDGGDTEWEYEWRIPRSYTSKIQNEYKIKSASSSDSGDYFCKGKMKNGKSSAEWSDAFRLTISDTDKTQPVLTVSPSWLSPGDSVTLSCSVRDPSAGWRFFWYKAVPKLPGSDYSYELLPDSITGTEQDSYIVHGQTHTAGYVCRAGRGDPVYYIDYSESKFVWSGDFHPAASLTVSPDRVQHFTSESLSLSCEGNSAEWRVRRFTKSGYLSACSNWGKITGSKCSIDSFSHGGVYWCESETGQFSNAVNITVHYKDVILVSPVLPVSEGDSVTLGCKLKTENVLSNVHFYKNGNLIQSSTRNELTIPAVSMSDEGFYKCKGTDSVRSLLSPESWMSVKTVSKPDSSPFPVLLIVGLVCGVLLIVLLLLFLYRYKKSKDSCFIRSQSTNQDSAPDHMINQDETQRKDTSSGDSCLYETIKEEKPEHDESSDVTYSLIELKNFANKEDSLMYAQIHSHNKAKRDKGKSSPAAVDETVYSEVKLGGALDNNAAI